jgi:hypothetical protein
LICELHRERFHAACGRLGTIFVGLWVAAESVAVAACEPLLPRLAFPGMDQMFQAQRARTRGYGYSTHGATPVLFHAPLMFALP